MDESSYAHLRLFKNRTEMVRNELHKTLRDTGIAQGDLEAKGWIRVVGLAVYVVPVCERMACFTERGRNRKAARTASQLVEHWRTRKVRPEERRQLSLFEMLDID